MVSDFLHFNINTLASTQETVCCAILGRFCTVLLLAAGGVEQATEAICN